jgi:hypothetical protein
VTPREALLLLRSALLGRSQGHVPLLAARVAPQSTASFAIGDGFPHRYTSLACSSPLWTHPSDVSRYLICGHRLRFFVARHQFFIVRANDADSMPRSLTGQIICASTPADCVFELTSRDATRGAPITTFDGIGPFSGACSLTCGPCRPSINSLFSHCHHERFDVRSSNESRWRGPLFVWLVIPHPVELGSLTAPLLMQWNVKLEEAFVFILSGFHRC